jgi:putative effector of murein hydrolase
VVAPQINDLWVYLSTTPLLGLTVTMLAYQAAWWVHRRSGSSPLANPVMIAVAALVALLAISGTSYQTYFDGAQFVHFLFDALRIDDAAIRGFATGVTAHGIGTARAFQESEQAGAFAALAMGMNGLVTALLLPVFLPLLQ